MRRTILIITLIFIIIMSVLGGMLFSGITKVNEAKRANAKYDISLGDEITGSQAATIMSRAIDQNERNKVPKDENGLYIENSTNSIKIELKMITIDNTYNMEAIYDKGITNFVANFNTINFKCTNIQYHKGTGLISRITFEEQE
ncbi:MAG: hypothetical protein FWC53_04365 [Firmicutes bacterium]|nr:hypothetical protein [Bacillota bacterium]